MASQELCRLHDAVALAHRSGRGAATLANLLPGAPRTAVPTPPRPASAPQAPTCRRATMLNATQQKILLAFVLGTAIFGAAQQGAISQGTALVLILVLTGVVRFGLLRFN